MTILPVTKERLLKVWWAHLWRLGIAIICAQLVLAFISFVAMIFILKLPIDSVVIKYISYALHPLAIAVYLIYSIVPLSMIIGKDFKGFRLVLISDETTKPISPK